RSPRKRIYHSLRRTTTVFILTTLFDKTADSGYSTPSGWSSACQISSWIGVAVCRLVHHLRGAQTCNHDGKGAIVTSLRLVCLLPLLFPHSLAAMAAPQVTSVFPLRGQQGSTYTADIRGQNPDKTSAVWSDCDALRPTVKGVEQVKPEAVE